MRVALDPNGARFYWRTLVQSSGAQMTSFSVRSRSARVSNSRHCAAIARCDTVHGLRAYIQAIQRCNSRRCAIREGAAMILRVQRKCDRRR